MYNKLGCDCKGVFGIITRMTDSGTKARILVNVDLGQKAARDLLGGVLRYAAFHPSWDVRIHRGHPMNDIPMSSANWRPDGIITDRALGRAQVKRMQQLGLKGIIALRDDEASGANSKVIEGLMGMVLEERAKAKAAKDWATSDHIRDVLNELGIKVKDTKDGVEWSL